MKHSVDAGIMLACDNAVVAGRLIFQMSKSVNNVQELGMLANSMTRDYSALAGDCRGAVAASANPQVSYFNSIWTRGV